MKHIDEHYKDWCGEHHTTNACHPVHDSAECTDFAEYYHKMKIEEPIQTKFQGCPFCENDTIFKVKLTHYTCKKCKEYWTN